MTASDTPSPLSSHAAAHLDRLESEAAQHQRLADGVFAVEVPGARGGVMTVAEAQRCSEEIAKQIEREEGNGSRRHRLVARWVKVLVWIFTAVIDFPIMLWFTVSVFNVDLANPSGFTFALALVVALLPTYGSTFALYEIGHNLRDHKTHDRDLRWTEIPTAARVGLIGIGLLLIFIFVSLSIRIFVEGTYSGDYRLTPLLAVLVSLVMLITNALVFWTAFCDGSLEQDDLRYYTKLVLKHLRGKREHELKAFHLRSQIERVQKQAVRDHAYRLPLKSEGPVTVEFTANSAGLLPSAKKAIDETAGAIANAVKDSSLQNSIALVGYTADPPDVTITRCQTLAELRAKAVEEQLNEALHARGVHPSMHTYGGGIAPGGSSIIGGVFDESRAARMRRVEIKY
ncbi:MULTISPECIES: hypothetical protein [Streptomyces]|uniref:OmpA-like domain-containing protein n=2 Tax=Streptomyces TaxID=1883 RepID=A0ABV9ITM8_9ACTN